MCYLVLALFIVGGLIGLFFTEPKFEEKTLETQMTACILLSLLFGGIGMLAWIVLEAVKHGV